MSRLRTHPRVLLRGAEVVVGDGDVLTETDVLLSAGRIEKMGTGLSAAPDTDVIDAHGKTLIPGLIDAHVHLDLLRARSSLHARLLIVLRVKKALRELLEQGVTSVRSMGDPLRAVLRVRDAISAGRWAGARMLVAGPVLTAPGGHPVVTVAEGNRWLQRRLAIELDSVQKARKTVRRLHAHGVDLIKIAYQGGRYGPHGIRLAKLETPVAAATIDEAHRLGLPVSAHVHYRDDVDRLLTLGVDLLEHGIIEEEIQGCDTLQNWAAAGVGLVPTLYITTLVVGEKGTTFHEVAARNLSNAYQAGVRIVAGTDSMIGALPSDSLHEELRLMAEAGIPAAEVLRMATGDAAATIGLSGRGTIVEGNVADLVLLNSSPLVRIENIADIAMVFSEGRLVHERAPSFRAELLGSVASPGGAEVYIDRTRQTVDHAAIVTRDMSRFDAEGTQTVSYVDVTDGSTVRIDTLASTRNLVTTRWECRIPGEDTHVFACRGDASITLSGTFRGVSVSRTYSLRQRTWLQSSLFDAATFITSSLDQLDFVAIGTNGRGALALTDFEIRKTGRTTSSSGQERITTRSVMPQWRRFWSASGQYDASTGALLSYQITGRRNKELILVRVTANQQQERVL